MLSHHYYIRSWTKHHFIVTPEELKIVLAPYHHVSCNGVQKGYVESAPETFLTKYTELYSRLSSGEKLSFEKDYELVNCSTGITNALHNCQYTPSTKLSIPNFLEPCVFLEPFCFLLWKDTLSKAFSTSQFPENIAGICISFPAKVEFLQDTEKHKTGLVSSAGLDDHDTYQAIVSALHDITAPLKLQIGEKTYRHSVRISRKAKEDFKNFYFISSSGAVLL